MNIQERAKVMTETILDIIGKPGDWERVARYIETELHDATASDEPCECGFRGVVCGECGADR